MQRMNTHYVMPPRQQSRAVWWCNRLRYQCLAGTSTNTVMDVDDTAHTCVCDIQWYSSPHAIMCTGEDGTRDMPRRACLTVR